MGYGVAGTGSLQPLRTLRLQIKKEKEGFPGGAVVKNPPANARDMGSSPGLEYHGATKPVRHNY